MNGYSNSEGMGGGGGIPELGGDGKKSNWERKVPTKSQRVSTYVVVDGEAVWMWE